MVVSVVEHGFEMSTFVSCGGSDLGREGEKILRHSRLKK